MPRSGRKAVRRTNDVVARSLRYAGFAHIMGHIQRRHMSHLAQDAGADRLHVGREKNVRICVTIARYQRVAVSLS